MSYLSSLYIDKDNCLLYLTTHKRREGGRMNELQVQVDKAIDLVKRLAMIIYEFKDDSQHQLTILINEYITILSTLSKSKDCTNLPLDLVQCLDEGRHPDYHLKSQLESLKMEKEIVHGKALAIASFREQLLIGLSQQQNLSQECKVALTGLQSSKPPKIPMVRLSLPIEQDQDGEEDAIIDVA